VSFSTQHERLGAFPPETRGESMAGCAVLIAMFALLVWPRRLDLPRAMPLLFVPVAAFAYGLTAQAPGALVQPLVVILLAGAAGLAAACFPEELRTRSALPTVLACAGAAVALYAVYQALGGLDYLVERIEAGEPVADRQAVLERARGGRAFALFETPASLGGYLVIVLPVTVTSALARAGAMRWLLVALAAVQVAGLLTATSATALAAILLAVLLAALRRSGSLRHLAVGSSLLFIVLVAVVLMRGGELTTLNDPNSPWRLRAGNFRIAAEMVADRPWVGVGPGGFGEVYPSYRRPGDNESQHVHNLPLELSAELGLPVGLLTTALFYYLFLGPLLRRRTEAPPWWRGLEVGLAAFALQNLADFTGLLPSLLWTAAILRGWISRGEAAASPSAPRWLFGATAATSLVAVALAASSGLAANAHAAARQFAVEGEDAEAERLARRAVRLAPWDVDSRLLHVQASLVASERDGSSLETALLRLDRTIRLSPVRPVARYLRSEVRRDLGDTPGAYADAYEAARLYPMKTLYAEHRDRLVSAVPRRSGPSP
jgi:O-antigen ligase